MKRRTESGVALVTSLIMLSVITFLAVAFLATSRRDRASVTMAASQSDARLMAEAAFARAQSEMLTDIITKDKKQTYSFKLSRSYNNTNGFVPGATIPGMLFNPTNVNFEYKRNGGALTQDELVENVGNLWLDPRVPVFVPVPRTTYTNWGGYDFRYYLDLNRNFDYDTNGSMPIAYLDESGNVVSTEEEHYIGDPEWIGVLERPEFPHSGTNRFIGRYAYVALPVSKTLDINYIHNQAKKIGPSAEGFLRNEGIGSYELNLAAFLHDLNTNAWEYNNYVTQLTTPSIGTAFDDALSILTNRYNRTYMNLARGNQALNLTNAGPVAQDLYADGPLRYDDPATANSTLRDDYTEPWSGSDNPNRYFNMQELFDARKTSIQFVNRLTNSMARTNAYDRYTYYRLLEQMGTDSEPDLSGKIHLNYDTRTNTSPAQMKEWQPLAQFTNIANRLLDSYYDAITNSYLISSNFPKLAVHRIPIHVPNYPQFRYNSTIHRILQVAANIVEATSPNNSYDAASTNKYPFVFRPLCHTENGTNFIVDYIIEQDPNIITNGVYREYYAANLSSNNVNQVVYDIPWVIGATKNHTPFNSTNKVGFPNFNEFTIETVAQITRKLELRKNAVSDLQIAQTNEMFILSISNRFGIEAWNSYTQAYAGPIDIMIFLRTHTYLTNQSGVIWPTPTNNGYQVHFRMETITNWAAATADPAFRTNSFVTPLFTNVIFLSNMQYSVSRGTFIPSGATSGFERSTEYIIPNWGLIVTNSIFYIAVDRRANRIIDAVNMSGPGYGINLVQALMGERNAFASNFEFSLWNTNRYRGSRDSTMITLGSREQIAVSGDASRISDTAWTSFTLTAPVGEQRAREVVNFARFIDPEAPIPADMTNLVNPPVISVETPFNPTRKFYNRMTWQVNDPLVHYTFQDLKMWPTVMVHQVLSPPNTPLPPNTFGDLNDVYNPWGGRSYPSGSGLRDPSVGGLNIFVYDYRVKDPGVDQSDDWNFPTNKFPSIGWLGRIHRGTPWQTIYMKPDPILTNDWLHWTGNPFTIPILDHEMFDSFTAVPNENSARGLLSVNQPGLAAWSAVLSGVPVLQVWSNDTVLTPMVIPPAGGLGGRRLADGRPASELGRIVAGINNHRTNFSDNVYTKLGQILGAPELTIESPFLRDGQLSSDQIQRTVTDIALERIPQQIMSLLKVDEQPRFVIYAWGQSLKPSDRSLVNNPPGGRQHLFNVSTNYQITGEFATRTVVRMEGDPERPRAVIESYNVLPTDEF